MRNTFSTAWQGSSQVRKQRKYRHNAPLHTKHTFLSSPLSKDLRTKYKKRNVEVRTGDEVKVMRGAFADKKAKVLSVNIKRERVTLEGITRQKKDGTKLAVSFHPSKLQLVSLATDDKKRLHSLERKGGTHASHTVRNA